MREKVIQAAKELGLDVDVTTLEAPTRTVPEAAARSSHAETHAWAVGAEVGREREVRPNTHCPSPHGEVIAT